MVYCFKEAVKLNYSSFFDVRKVEAQSDLLIGEALELLKEFQLHSS